MGIVVNTPYPSSSSLLLLCVCRTPHPPFTTTILLNTYHINTVPSLLSSSTILLTSVQHWPASLSSLSDLDFTPPTPSSSPFVAGDPFSRRPRHIIVCSRPPPSATFKPPPLAVYFSFILDLLFNSFFDSSVFLLDLSCLLDETERREEWVDGHRVAETWWCDREKR